MPVLIVGRKPSRPGRYYYATSRSGPRFIVKVYPRDDGKLCQMIEGDDLEELLDDTPGAWSEEPI